MKYVLDTNIISEFMRPEPDQHVISWFHDFNEQAYLNSISLQELYYGIFLMPEGRKKKALKETVDAVAKECADRTLNFDGFCGFLCGQSHARTHLTGKAATIEDLMIAAICERHGATLVTHNVKDLDYLGIELIDPFNYESPVLAELRRREAARKQ